MRRPLALVTTLVVLAAAAPMAASQGGAGAGKNFAVVGVERAGDDVRIAVKDTHMFVRHVTVSLAVDGIVIPPEHTFDSWATGHVNVVSWRVGHATEAELRVHFFQYDGGERDERTPISIPARPQEALVARLEAEDVRRLDPSQFEVDVRSIGERASGRALAWLEDGAGARVGSPLHHALEPLAPGERATLRFVVHDAPQRFTLRIEHDNQTRALLLGLPNATHDAQGARLVVLRATRAGVNATISMAATGASPVERVSAWVESTEGVRIGDPIVRHLGQVPAGGTADASFGVPRDMEDLVVALEYDNRTERTAVRLAAAEGAASSVLLTLATDLPSREAQPGETATYQLQLTNRGPEALITLSSTGLPPGYEVRFLVDGTSVPSLRAGADSVRDLQVSVRVPATAGRDAGTRLPFTVQATGADGGTATLDLALTLRGAGRLDLTGDNWFSSSEAEHETRVEILVRNSGSAPVHGIRLQSAAPPGWRVSFEPPRIERLDPSETHSVSVTYIPPPDAGAGRYHIDLSASATDVTAPQRSLSVEVVAGGGSGVGWLVGAGLAGLATVALIVKLRRK